MFLDKYQIIVSAINSLLKKLIIKPFLSSNLYIGDFSHFSLWTNMHIHLVVLSSLPMIFLWYDCLCVLIRYCTNSSGHCRLYILKHTLKCCLNYIYKFIKLKYKSSENPKAKIFSFLVKIFFTQQKQFRSCSFGVNFSLD